MVGECAMGECAMGECVYNTPPAIQLHHMSMKRTILAGVTQFSGALTVPQQVDLDSAEPD